MTDESQRPIACQARWVFTGDGEPIERGVVEVTGGKISAIRDRADRDTIDLSDVALIPGLVNAHTHLEFSGLSHPLQPMQPFTKWIGAVVAERRGRRASGPDPIGRGLEECELTGTAAIGEIATEDWPAEALARNSPRSVLFRELIGFSDAAVETQREIAKQHLATHQHNSQRVGLSPHAPYSVSPQLLEECIRLAVAFNCPVAMHVAETPEEIELLDRGTGPLVDMLKAMGVWREKIYAAGTRPIEILRRLADAPSAIIAHGNYLDDDEIKFLANQPQMTVVYCPRTHAQFGHRRYPLESFLQHGVRVGLGTDSRASNPDLNLWEEAKFVAANWPGLERATILEMATVAGARALKLPDFSGGMRVGEPAGLCVVTLDAEAKDPFDALFSPQSQATSFHRAVQSRI